MMSEEECTLLMTFKVYRGYARVGVMNYFIFNDAGGDLFEIYEALGNPVTSG